LSVTPLPEPDVFQPWRPVSKPEFATRFPELATVIVVLAVENSPTV
jgi:hypothetical protein